MANPDPRPTAARNARPPKFIRIVRARPRLFLSAAVGLLVILALAVSGAGVWAARLLIGWNVGVLLYLILAYEIVFRADTPRIRRHAALQDEGQMAMLIVTVAAPVASLIALVAELGGHGDRTGGQIALALSTIALSWTMIHTLFALHYAHEFYDPDEGRRGGLVFPGEGEPGYWDFVYFSFVIGMTSQVSDVAVRSPAIRRVVTAHGILSFFFNTALIALSVNIAAGIL